MHAVGARLVRGAPCVGSGMAERRQCRESVLLNRTSRTRPFCPSNQAPSATAWPGLICAAMASTGLSSQLSGSIITITSSSPGLLTDAYHLAVTSALFSGE